MSHFNHYFMVSACSEFYTWSLQCKVDGQKNESLLKKRPGRSLPPETWNATTASTCIAIVDELAFLCLRLPFGTTPAPAEYTNFSEAAIVVGNDLLQVESWDTDDLNSPHQSLIPQEENQQSVSHLATADPLSVDITATEASMDGLIDHIITITVDDKHWIDCAKSAALLVIHTLFRPLQQSEPLKRDDPLSLSKLAGDGKLAEQKTCLVWDINTQSLRVSLPNDRKTAWTNDIKEALASTNLKTDTLESLIGKLNHAAKVIPPEQYFLNRIWHLLKRGWGGVGTTEAPTMASPISSTVDEITPTCHYQGGTNQQHSLCQTISNDMVRRLWIWHRGV